MIETFFYLIIKNLIHMWIDSFCSYDDNPFTVNVLFIIAQSKVSVHKVNAENSYRRSRISQPQIYLFIHSNFSLTRSTISRLWMKCFLFQRQTSSNPHESTLLLILRSQIVKSVFFFSSPSFEIIEVTATAGNVHRISEIALSMGSTHIPHHHRLSQARPWRKEHSQWRKAFFTLLRPIIVWCEAPVWVWSMLLSLVGHAEREEWMKMGHLLITKYDHFYVLCCSRFSWSPCAISFLAPRCVDSPIVVVICLEFLLTSMSWKLLGARCDRRKESRDEWWAAD